MVRRGSRTSGPSPVSNASLSSGSNEAQWKSGRAHSVHSADTSLAKSTKSSDSASSSPVSRDSTSPTVSSKKSGSKAARSSSNWRGSRGGGLSGRSSLLDAKFMITSEDFPALPGVPGMRQGGTANSTPSKYSKKEKDRDGGKLFQGDLAVTDDSGISSASRGHTPTDNSSGRNGQKGAGRGDFENKKKPILPLLPLTESRKKNASPAKERPPRGSIRPSRYAANQPVAATSPKKKTIHANAANTAPSFMKLSKIGQKVPERRGGPRQHNHSPQSPSPTNDDKENAAATKKENSVSSLVKTENNVDIALEIEKEDVKKRKKEATVVSEPQKAKKTVESVVAAPTPPTPSYCIFHPSDVPKIILGPDGEMSNIPPTMLTDQYGMAAMLPILDIVKNRSVNVNPASLTEEELREKISNENIEMTTIGFDLNELGVPMKLTESNPKKVWESFAGPFGSHPLLPTGMGLTYTQVPSVYYTARTLQTNFDMLQNVPEKFGVHELFYIFYNLPREIWQLNAARELQYRGWRYNIKEKLWVLKKLGDTEELGVTPPQSVFTPPNMGQEDVMVGVFEIYDAEKARICSAEMMLRRSDFEVPAWEQKVPDNYQRMLSTVFPKESLWGPREDRKNHGFLQGITGMFPNLSTRSKLANLTITKPTQSSERRLLSFADSPDIVSNFENPFGSLPSAATTAEDVCRQQMYALILQKMQMHQQQQQQHFQQQLAASNQTKLAGPSSSFSSTNHFSN